MARRDTAVMAYHTKKRHFWYAVSCSSGTKYHDNRGMIMHDKFQYGGSPSSTRPHGSQGDFQYSCDIVAMLHLRDR